MQLRRKVVLGGAGAEEGRILGNSVKLKNHFLSSLGRLPSSSENLEV